MSKDIRQKHPSFHTLPSKVSSIQQPNSHKMLAVANCDQLVKNYGNK